MTCEEILNSLNPQQAEAASCINGAVLVLAGAGTGKTRVITYRIAYMLQSGIAPERILGLTFTNKAAAEMRERLGGLVGEKLAKCVTLGTFHSFCVRVLRAEIGKLGYLPCFTIADESDQQGLFKQASANLGLNGENFPLADIISRVGRWKNALLGAKEAAETAENDFDRCAASVYGEYQHLMELQNVIDFDDMLFLVYRLFSEHSEVLEKYQSRYSHLLIDEYQDTNDAQFTLVKMLVEKSGNLCVVGDDDQSIYSWRGANIGNIIDFPQMFPGSKVVKLEQNYRSTENILAAANAVIGNNAKRHAKSLWSKLGKGELITVTAAQGGREEAQLIADLIRQSMADDCTLHYSDFAVLFRSNHLSRELEITFREGGLPYRLVGGQEFYKRKEVKDAASYLKILVNSSDDQSLLRILSTPTRGLADKAVGILKTLRRSRNMPMTLLLGDSAFQQQLGGKGAASAAILSGVVERYRQIFAGAKSGVSRLVTDYLREVGYLDGLQRIYKDIKDATKRQENVYEFINSIAIFEQKNSGASLADFLESFSLLEENDRTAEAEDEGDAVTFSTVHASKGLEYKTVFLMALERGVFPHERAIEEGSLDEELRLFYVAVTRARQKLFITRAEERMVRGMHKVQMPSPFLRLICGGMTEVVEPDELVREASAAEQRAAFNDIFEILRKKRACKK